MLRLRRILALILKEFLAILKDPKSRLVVIGPPVIQFFVFGYAATYDLRDVAYGVYDESRTPESRALLARFQGSDCFELRETLAGPAQVREAIDAERVRMVIHVGPGFAEDLHAGRQASVQVVLDGRNSNVASIGLGYVSEVVSRFAQDWALRHGAGPSPEAPALRLETRAWYNPNLESRWFLVSALGGQIAMLVVMILSSLSVAREREFGTFDQLLVSPFTPLEILVGKAAPALAFGLLDGLLLSAAGVLWFGVPLLGSPLALLLTLSVFVLSITGVGLFISSMSQTMQQALLGSFMFIMPVVILSGFTTPLESMPGWLQRLTVINPFRHAVAILRQVFLEGAGVADVLPLLTPMVAIAAVTLTAAAWLFRARSA